MRGKEKKEPSRRARTGADAEGGTSTAPAGSRVGGGSPAVQPGEGGWTKPGAGSEGQPGPVPLEDGGHLGVSGLGPAPEALLAASSASGGSGSSERPGKYVYCIVHTDQSLRFGPIGIGSEPAEVHTVNYHDIAAVVSDTPLEVYDPTRENVLAHERVNEAVMRKHTVIPMSFNTVFKTREDIIELLRSAYDAFRDVLGKMEDKLEFGLKVVWDPELVIREIEKENENLRMLRQEISSQKGSTYFARMQYGRLVDSLLQDRSEHLVAEIFAALSDVAVASRANKPIGDKMILNAAFLVARDREADFDAKVKEIDSKYANLKFKYTGPWPPYNFVNIRLKLERAEAE
ncbi:MAG TPA: GvpL/GvpF family gas vesicle protein [Thermoanaerobaculia bacterium]|nr:GvpL/GvpF family gas vesicle protein [Thermoanaerobaculia bacterium]